jgi:hypothetical protein
MQEYPEFEHVARVVSTSTKHGLVHQQWIRGLEAPLLEEVLPKINTRKHYNVRWIDFRCDSASLCGYPQTFGGNPQRLCGATYVALDPHLARYNFTTSRELMAQPELMTPWGLEGLRQLQKRDSPHPPFPRNRSDEIAGVLAKMPLSAVADEETMRMTDAMTQTLEDAIRRRNGEVI